MKFPFCTEVFVKLSQTQSAVEVTTIIQKWSCLMFCVDIDALDEQNQAKRWLTTVTTRKHAFHLQASQLQNYCVQLHRSLLLVGFPTWYPPPFFIALSHFVLDHCIPQTPSLHCDASAQHNVQRWALRRLKVLLVTQTSEHCGVCW